MLTSGSKSEPPFNGTVGYRDELESQPENTTCFPFTFPSRRSNFKLVLWFREVPDSPATSLRS
jgi:hypothetical protein